MCLINLQGKLNCKYVVGFYFSHKPQRATLRERWPPSVEENLTRLEDAGLPYDRQIPKCSNCGGEHPSFFSLPLVLTINNDDDADLTWQKWATSRAAARKSVPCTSVSRSSVLTVAPLDTARATVPSLVLTSLHAGTAGKSSKLVWCDMQRWLMK